MSLGRFRVSGECFRDGKVSISYFEQRLVWSRVAPRCFYVLREDRTVRNLSVLDLASVARNLPADRRRNRAIVFRSRNLCVRGPAGVLGWNVYRSRSTVLHPESRQPCLGFSISSQWLWATVLTSHSLEQVCLGLQIFPPIPQTVGGERRDRV